MCNRFLRRFIVLALGAALTPSALATTLAQAYRDALQNDPSFAKAKMVYEAAKLDVWLARTGYGVPGAGLLPSVALNSGINKDYYQDASSTSKTYGISVTQPLFNFASWKAIESAKFSVKAAAATYFAAAQDLMQRVASAYIEVLRAREMLILIQAQKQQLNEQYLSTWNRYQVGLLAITPVYEAKSQYDQVVVDEIKQKNALQTALANLVAITGSNIKQVNLLKATIPLYTPKPNHFKEWAAVCEKQNYLLQADLNNMLAQQENIKVAAAGMLPSLAAVGGYQSTTTSTTMPIKTGTTNYPSGNPIKDKSLGLSLSFPIFRGGYDIVNTKKARYQYLAESEQLEIDHRKLINQLKQTFMTIKSSIDQLKADQEAVNSAQKQLTATQAGYEVGSYSMVDVLDSVANLAVVNKQYANDRYNYLLSFLGIKQISGTLTPNDLQVMSSWLQTGAVNVMPTPQQLSGAKHAT